MRDIAISDWHEHRETRRGSTKLIIDRSPAQTVVELRRRRTIAIASDDQRGGTSADEPWGGLSGGLGVGRSYAMESMRRTKEEKNENERE